MKALRLATTSKDREKLDAKSRELLTLAEHIKTSKTWRPNRNDIPASDAVSRAREPVSTRTLSNREEIILLEDSKLNGFVFPPWSALPNPCEFDLPESGEFFTYVSSAMLSLADNLKC
jgi:hypothetical protein